MDGFETIHQRHGDFCEDQIGAQSLRSIYQAASIANSADDSELTGEKLAEPGYEETMSVGN
jgi:hypothetical protein